MEKQKILDFAPGEREAVAQMVHDSSRVSLALRSAQRRWRKNVLTYVAILLLWLICYGFLIEKLTDWAMSWTFGFELHVPWSLYRPGRCLGLIVSFIVYGCAHQGWCLELGSHIKIQRATIPSRIVAISAVLVGLWLLALTAVRVQWWLMMWWSKISWLINLTGFVLVFLGYLITVFSLDAFTTTSRKQIIKEEKWAFGIFE